MVKTSVQLPKDLKERVQAQAFRLTKKTDYSSLVETLLEEWVTKAEAGDTAALKKVHDSLKSKQKYLRETEQLHTILDYGSDRIHRIVTTVLEALDPKLGVSSESAFDAVAELVESDYGGFAEEGLGPARGSGTFEQRTGFGRN